MLAVAKAHQQPTGYKGRPQEMAQVKARNVSPSFIIQEDNKMKSVNNMYTVLHDGDEDDPFFTLVKVVEMDCANGYVTFEHINTKQAPFVVWPLKTFLEQDTGYWESLGTATRFYNVLQGKD
jgi:hypothetical protein